MTVLETVLEDIRVETQRLRKQLRTERYWRWAILLVVMLVIAAGLRVEQVRRESDRRDERSACMSGNEARAAIVEAFDILIAASLSDAPPEDPRHERAKIFTDNLVAKLPQSAC